MRQLNATLLQGSDHDKKWVQYVRKIYNAMHNMDKQKYLEPKFSTSFLPIIKFLSKKIGPGSTQTNISILSQREGTGLMTDKVNMSLAGAGGANNFNDTFSLGSLLSLADQQLLARQRSSLENNLLSTTHSRLAAK